MSTQPSHCRRLLPIEQCEGGKKVYVAYFDVSKAFDPVWINWLDFQLYELGVTGSLWRLFYKTHTEFSCFIRIGDRTSEPYNMLCDIHQGGFLSLVKYITFIDSLLVELKQSDLCCTIEGVQTTPQGYADNLATYILSGMIMERVLGIVDGGKKVYVAYFDVSKAFDPVWINGLDFQLYELGVTGSLWRLFFKTHTEFSCFVRIGDRTSEPNNMLCGIHQGGFLSLVKYITFIDSLLVELKQSDLCCTIERVQTIPQGYADNLATYTLSGMIMERVLGIVERHGRVWRYPLMRARVP